MADAKDLARDILAKTGVSTVPGTDFGLPDTLRLSFCNDRYNEAIDRLRDYFSA
jgi:aspartate/methionine/tyrosine aminotransferase